MAERSKGLKFVAVIGNREARVAQDPPLNIKGRAPGLDEKWERNWGYVRQGSFFHPIRFIRGKYWHATRGLMIKQGLAMENKRRWFQLGNLVPALTIILALLGALGYPKGLVALRDQLVLSVLGLLAIDALIERHGYHEKMLGIASNLQSLEIKPRLYPRSTVHADDRMSDMIRNSKSLLIAGPTLLSTVGQNLEAFREAAIGGKSIRLLLMPPDLDAKCMDWLANLYGMSGSDLKDHLNSSFTSIKNLYNSILPEHRQFLEVRLLKTVPAASFVMQNSRTNDGLILYEVHLFGRSAADRPCLRLKPSETQMYSAYEGAIEALWEASIPWSPDRFATKR